MSEKFTDREVDAMIDTFLNIPTEEYQAILDAASIRIVDGAYENEATAGLMLKQLRAENAEMRSKIERYNSQSALTISTLVVEKEKLEQQLAEAKRRIEYFEAKDSRDLAEKEFEKQQADCREFTNRSTAQGEES